MSREYRYFKVTGGKVGAAYDRWLKKRIEQSKSRELLRNEFGAVACYANHQHIEGLVFKNPGMVPTGWKPCGGERSAWRPSGNAKEMRVIRKRLLNDYPLADAQAFQAEVCGKDNPFLFMNGLQISFMVFEKFGGIFILLVPKVGDGDSKGKWLPPDSECVEIKTSEYWEMKEAVEEKVPKSK